VVNSTFSSACLSGGIRKLTAVHARQADIGEQQIDIRIAFQHRSALGPASASMTA
jgi:hypothetical protein